MNKKLLWVTLVWIWFLAVSPRWGSPRPASPSTLRDAWPPGARRWGPPPPLRSRSGRFLEEMKINEINNLMDCLKEPVMFADSQEVFVYLVMKDSVSQHALWPLFKTTSNLWYICWFCWYLILFSIYLLGLIGVIGCLNHSSSFDCFSICFHLFH